MNKRLVLIFCLLFFTCILIPAADFGLILDQNADYGGFVRTAGDFADGTFAYSGIFIPRVSALLGDVADIFISAGFETSFNEKWFFVPELLRTELSIYSGMVDFTIGRMFYSDPLGFIADGLFDGMSLALLSEAGTFSLGAWYTGFLYKRRANIAMTYEEALSYAIPFEYNDFFNTYFAPRRFVAALGWEHLGGSVQKMVSVLGQFDLNNGFNFSGESLLHSQYLIGKFSIPGNLLSFDLGGALGLIQYGGEPGMSFAAELGITLTPPASFPNRLSFLGRYSTGNAGGQVSPFQPITVKTQGEILGAKLSGISFVSLDYAARLHRTLSLGITSSCFIRSDLETYMTYPTEENSGGYFLGTEFFGRLLWSPLSDLQFNLGGGAFLPALGNAARSADISWRAELNAVISLR
jgi:hypothetical protein